jgi:hypothetical protein
MSGRLPYETDDEYFKRMVERNKPVSDHLPSQTPEPLSGTPEWQTKFWQNLVEKKKELTCSTSTSEPSCSTSASTTPKETGTRPKTSRRNSTRVTPPSEEEKLIQKALHETPYETPKWLENKLKREGTTYPNDKDYIITPMPGGSVMLEPKMNGVSVAAMPFQVYYNANGQSYLDWSEKHKIYFALQKMNLRDPEVIAKIAKACSSKPDEDEKDKKDKSDKKPKRK